MEEESGEVSKIYETYFGFIKTSKGDSLRFPLHSLENPKQGMKVTFVRTVQRGKNYAIHVMRKVEVNLAVKEKVCAPQPPSVSMSSTEFDDESRVEDVVTFLKKLYSVTQDPSTKNEQNQKLATFLFQSGNEFQDVLINVLTTETPQQVLNVFALYLVLVCDLAEKFPAVVENGSQFLEDLPGYLLLHFPQQGQHKKSADYTKLLLSEQSGDLAVQVSNLLVTRIDQRNC